MAILKTSNGRHKYFDDDSRKDVLDYILDPVKMPHGYCGKYTVDQENPHESMLLIAERYGKTFGVKLRHFIISFDPSELTDPKKAYDIALDIADFFIRDYQTVFAVHEDKDHLHIHFVINSISYVNGERYYGK